MGIRPAGLLEQARPDNTSAVVGAEGLPVRQDIDGTQIQRLGIAGADADWGPEQVEITDDEAVIADPERVGGTTSSSGIIRSLDGENCEVVYAWTSDISQISTIAEAEADETTVVERLDATDSEITIRNVTTKSDNCKVFVEDASEDGVENTVEFTLNFH